VIEQILKAVPKPDGSAVLLKTEGVHKTVSDENYRFLMEATEQIYWLEEEKVVALIHRESCSDVAGRNGELRHIQLIPWTEYIAATAGVFDKFRITSENIPEKLEPIQLMEPI